MKEKNKKITTGYSLDGENKQWLAAKAREQDRSASSYLNCLLTKMRDQEHNDQ